MTNVFNTPELHTEAYTDEDGHEWPAKYSVMEQGADRPYIYDKATVESKIANLTAKAAAITVGAEPDAETQPEAHADWQARQAAQNRYIERAAQFQQLLDSTP